MFMNNSERKFKGEFDSVNHLSSYLYDPYNRIEIVETEGKILVNGNPNFYINKEVVIVAESDMEKFRAGEFYVAAKVSDELLEDKAVAMQLVERNPSVLMCLPPDLTHNKEFMNKAVDVLMEKPYSVETCVVLEDVMKNNPLAKDKEFVMKAVEADYHFIKDSPLKDDMAVFIKSFAMHEVEKGYFSERIDKMQQKASFDLHSEGRVDNDDWLKRDKLIAERMIVMEQKEQLKAMQPKSKGFER